MKKHRVRTANVDVTDDVIEAGESEKRNKSSVKYLAEQYGLNVKLVYQRLRHGWPIERALTETSRRHTPSVTIEKLAAERGMTGDALVSQLLKNAPNKRKVS